MKYKTTKLLPVLTRTFVYILYWGIIATVKQKQKRTVYCHACREGLWRFCEMSLLALEASPLGAISQAVMLGLLFHTSATARIPNVALVIRGKCWKVLLNSQRILVGVILSEVIRYQTDGTSYLNRDQIEPVLNHITDLHDYNLVSLSLRTNEQCTVGSKTVWLNKELQRRPWACGDTMDLSV